MKKDFLTGLKISDEVADQIMAENGKDIEREKNKYSDRDTIKKQLDDTLAELEKVKAMKPEELQKKVEDMTAQLTTAQKEAAQQIAQLKTKSDVDEYLATVTAGGKHFVNKITRDTIAKSLAEKLTSDEAKGKGIADLFGEITKDQTDIFADDTKPQPPTVVPMKGTPPTASKKDEEAEAREIMGLPPVKE